MALVENHGHVLTKDELLQGVWSGQLVEEGNLNRQISRLRGALGETSGEPQYVETIPKVGYRFVAPVQEIRDRGADLVIERHTIARIVTEEEEAANGGDVFDPPSFLFRPPTSQIRTTEALSICVSGWRHGGDGGREGVSRSG